MRQFLFVLTAMFFLGCDRPKPDFKKYILPLGVIYNNGQTVSQATGFVIKKNKKIFLVTNYHVISGFNTVDTGRIFTPERLEIIFTDKKQKPEVKSIDLTKIIKPFRHYYFFEKPDIFCLDITHLISDDIQYTPIEDFIQNIPNEAIKPDSVFTIGIQDGNQVVLEYFINNNVSFKPKSFSYNGRNIVLKNSYFLSNSIAPGMSGSPVFFQYGNKYIFAGVASSHFQTENITLVVKPQEVLKLIDSLSALK